MAHISSHDDDARSNLIDVIVAIRRTEPIVEIFEKLEYLFRESDAALAAIAEGRTVSLRNRP